MHIGKMAGALLVLMLAPQRAAAQQPEPFVLEASCIAPSELEARLQPLLPASLFAKSVLQGVQVRVLPKGPEHEVEIVLPAREDHAAITRSLRGETCETVVDATILVIGLWVSESFTAPAPAATPLAPAPVEPVAARPPEPDGEREPVRWGALLGGSVSSALLPKTALAIELAGALSWRTLHLSLGARWWPSQTEGASNARVEASLIEGDLVVAWLPLAFGALELGPGVGLAVGRLQVRGVGVDDPRERVLVWLRSELVAHGRLRWPGTPVAIWARAGGALPWTRPRVEIGGQGTAFRPAALSPYATLGIELVTP